MPEEDYYIPNYLEIWEEQECEIDGLIEIFRDACKKDKGRTSYEFGAGISKLEYLIEECIDIYMESNKFLGKCIDITAEDWKEALKDAKRCK